MRRLLAIGAAAGLLMVPPACGGSEPDSTTTTTAEASASEAMPFHPIPADAVGVTGTAVCGFPGTGGNFTAVCELEMSDPRVSGTETTDHYQFNETGEVAGVWVAEALITNADGTWRGIAQAADDSTPCGEAHYVGEDGYVGLEFHYYFCHVGDPAQLRGWISGGG